MIKHYMDKTMTRRAKQLYTWLKPALPLTGTLLDVGSGTGHNARFIAKNSALHITETDVVNMNSFGKEPIHFDGQHLPFESAEFDSAMMLFSLHYAAQPVKLLKDVRRVAPRKLLLLQSTYSGLYGRSILALREAVQGRLSCHIAQQVGFVNKAVCSMNAPHLYSRSEMRATISASGWRETNCFPHSWRGAGVSRDLFVLEPVG